MTLYRCIDIIDSRLLQLNNIPANHETILLQALKQDLIEREKNNNYLGLSLELEKIFPVKESNSVFSYIYNDLDLINQLVLAYQDYAGETLDEKMEDFLDNYSPYPFLKKFKPFRAAKVSLPFSYKQYGSSGNCYGFVYAMVDKSLSPYENELSMVDLNSTIHSYQRNQSQRINDQRIIKRTRLTHELFEPRIENQAKKIIDFANQHQDKHLTLRLRVKNKYHAVYLSVRSNGTIRYMDPTYDAYIFNSENDFIEFYKLTASRYQPQYNFYQIRELHHNPEQNLCESLTWRGKLRTLLTGNKYSDGEIFSTRQTIFYPLIGIIAGALIGVALGGIIGGLLAVTVGAISGVAIIGGLVSFLQYKAHQSHHKGLLGIPHYLQEWWFNLHHENSSHCVDLADGQFNNSMNYMLDNLQITTTPIIEQIAEIPSAKLFLKKSSEQLLPSHLAINSLPYTI